MSWSILRVLTAALSPWWWIRLTLPSTRRRTVAVFPPVTGPRRLVIDVSRIAQHNAETGIQRVVRAVAREFRGDPRGWTIQTVRWQQGAFRHSNWPLPDDQPGARLTLGCGDVFLGLDLSLDAIRRNLRTFRRQRNAGAIFWFVIYDLLPLELPRFFSSKLVTRFRWWFVATAKIADGYACISESTATAVRSTVIGQLRRDLQPSIAVIPMGFDSLPDRSISVGPQHSSGRCRLLAVGTVEPRKGYDDIVDALDLLWGGGFDVMLTIVGGPGWKTEALQRRLRNHPEAGVRLVWETELADYDLAALYQCADMLIVASHGEGYGLPVIEALAHGCPILARDIAVFREHADQGLAYFPRTATAQQIAAAIRAVVASAARSLPPESRASLPRWHDTADALWRLIADDAEPGQHDGFAMRLR